MAQAALESGIPMKDILSVESKDDLAKVKFEEDFESALNVVLDKMDKEFAALGGN